MNTHLFAAGCVRGILRHRLRTFFMSLGIVVGVAALVVMRSMGTDAEQDLRGKLDRMFGAGSIIIVNGSDVMRGGRGSLKKLTIADIEALAAEMSEIVAWDPMLATSGREVQAGPNSHQPLIVGHSERADEVWRRGVVRGEFFSLADVRAASRVALLGRRTAETLFGDEDPIGKSIRIGGAPFRVKGILEDYGIDPHGMDRDDEVHVPITTLMRRILDMETIGSAKVLVSSPDLVDGAADRISEILRERHGLSAGQPDDFSIYTPMQVQEVVEKAGRVLTLWLPATAGIALLVATLVIVNVMLMGVRERIPEIGLRKAVGATDGQISLQFFLESIAISALSGLAGVALAAIGMLGADLHGIQVASPTAGAVTLGMLSAIIVGVVAGVVPARRAARQEPVEALR